MLREPQRLGVWACTRAGLISLALVSQCVSAIPSRTLTETQLARPEGQRAVTWVATLFRVIGQQPQRRQIEQLLLGASRSISSSRDKLLAPLAPITRAAAMSQAWSLFSLGIPVAFRLQIEARTPDGAWQLVYRANGEDPLGLAPWLTYRRMRGLYNPSTRSGLRPSYDGVVTWLARKILGEHRQYDAIKVGIERLQFATRDQPSASLGIEAARERRRSELP